MSTYVLLDEFKEYVRDQVTVDDTILQNVLDGAEHSIDDHCGRSFGVASGTPSVRHYTPDSGWSSVLRIHDCVSITSVVDNGTTVTTYQAEPVDGLDVTGRTVPYEQLRQYAGYWGWDQGRALVAVTADWGWEATPAPVVEATKIIAKDILTQRNNNSGVAGFGEYGAIRVQANKIALGLLRPLRRVEAFGVA